tara:strand:+ start:2298 stop:2930 length:633 start_codon:yes stop_codon:yes gene_type:complete
MNQINYWKTYYDKPQKGKKPPSAPSLFAKFVQNMVNISDVKRIIDVGCGNGRDAYYFANENDTIKVLGVDSAIASEKVKNVSFVMGSMGDLNDLIESKNVQTMLYSRFSLHSIPKDIQSKVLLYAKTNCKYISIEARSTKDPLSNGEKSNSVETSYAIPHYRRYIDLNGLVTELESLGFTIIHKSDSNEYAPYKDQKPWCVRVLGINKNL